MAHLADVEAQRVLAAGKNGDAEIAGELAAGDVVVIDDDIEDEEVEEELED
jgi:hypothetical protein